MSYDPMVNDPADFRQQFSRNLNVLLTNFGCKETGFGRVKEVAALFKMSTTSAQKWLTGSSLPEMHKIPGLCRTLGCTLDQLFFGIDATPEMSSIRSAGRDLEPLLIFSNSATRHAHVSKDFFRSSSWAPGVSLFEVDDDMMEPFVVKGEYVLIEPVSDAEHLSGVYVLLNDGRFSIRRLQETMQQTVILLCENKRFAPEEIPVHMFHVVHENHVLADESGVGVIGRVTGRILRR